MLGFRPLPTADVVAVDPDLEPVNEILKDYEAAWDSHVDVWLVIRVPDPACVYKCDPSLPCSVRRIGCCHIVLRGDVARAALGGPHMGALSCSGGGCRRRWRCEQKASRE